MVSSSAVSGLLGAGDEGLDALGERVSVSLARPAGRARGVGKDSEIWGWCALAPLTGGR